MREQDGKLREVRDPVHGFIVYDRLERDLIDSKPFQRLRRIKQLAFTHLVYPGAVHTRFEHSLGVMEVASQLFDTLVQKGGYRLLHALGLRRQGEAERLRRVLRVAALLHDLGHAPFSHALEETMLPGGHEEMTARLVRDTEIRTIIEDEHYRAGIRVEEDVIPVAVGPKYSGVTPTAVTQFLGELLTGVFGADRMDYLLRDSLHTGVRYGYFDLHRVVRTLSFVESETGEPAVALEVGGVHAAEGLILARYFMFQQVYCHPVRRVYDYHLSQALKGLFPDGRWPSSPGEYLEWDDARVESELFHAPSNGRSRWAEILANRKHFKVVFDAPGGDVERYVERRGELGELLGGRFGEEVYVDSEYRQLVRDRELNVSVVGREGRSSWARESKIFGVLPPIAFFRVYAERRENLAEEVRRVVSEFFA